MASGEEYKLQIARTTSQREQVAFPRRVNRADQVFAHAAARQPSIENDVVYAADHDYPGAGVAYFGQLIEPFKNRIGTAITLDQDDVRRRRIALGFTCGSNAAHLDFHMCFGQAPVLSGCLNDRSSFDRFAKSLDRYPRCRRDVRIVFAGCRGWYPRVFDCDLLGVLNHFPTSLILPES